MKTSPEITKITPAFLKAQKKIVSVIKDKKNPYYNSKYADHTAVIDACKEQLNDNGIAILQPINGMMVETVLLHESGEWFSSETPIVSKDANDPQKLGSAITYAKRYGLQSMVLLPAKDDDGNEAATVGRKTPVPTPQPTTTKMGFATMPQLKKIAVMCDVKGYNREELKMKYNVASAKELTFDQAKEIIDMLEKLPDKPKEAKA